MTVIAASNQAAIIHITSPSLNSSVQLPNSVNINADVIDEDGFVTSVTYTLHGNQGRETITATYSNGEWIATWSPKQAGNYVIEVLAIDNSNNMSSYSSPISVLPAPNQNPTITITSPTNNTSDQLPNIISLSSNANDTDGSIHTVVYEIKNASNQVISTHNGNGNEFSASWTPSQAGDYTVIATVTDNLGATSTDQVSIIITNNQNPTVSITDPIQNDILNLNSTVEITANANDNDGTVTKVDFIITNTQTNQASTLSSTSNPYSVNWQANTIGEYSIEAIAFDNDGGQATSASVLVNILDPLAVDLEISQEFEIYPLPVSNELHVNIDPSFGNNSFYEVLDLNGANIQSGELNYSINVSELRSGSYIIRILNESKVTHKVFQKID